VSQDFEAFYQRRASQGPEETLDPLVMSEDGRGIVMRKEDLREGMKRAAERDGHKLKPVCRRERSATASAWRQWRRCTASSGKSARSNRSWAWKARRRRCPRGERTTNGYRRVSSARPSSPDKAEAPQGVPPK
jgi:hypothetical protein